MHLDSPERNKRGKIKEGMDADKGPDASRSYTECGKGEAKTERGNAVNDRECRVPCAAETVEQVRCGKEKGADHRRTDYTGREKRGEDQAAEISFFRKPDHKGQGSKRENGDRCGHLEAPGERQQGHCPREDKEGDVCPTDPSRVTGLFPPAKTRNKEDPGEGKDRINDCHLHETSHQEDFVDCANPKDHAHNDHEEPNCTEVRVLGGEASGFHEMPVSHYPSTVMDLAGTQRYPGPAGQLVHVAPLSIFFARPVDLAPVESRIGR